METNNSYFIEAQDKLQKWAEDMECAAEKELKDTKMQVKNAEREARTAETLEQQHELQKRISELKKKQKKQRQNLFDVEDQVEDKRKSLVLALEKRLTRKTYTEDIFIVNWNVV